MSPSIRPALFAAAAIATSLTFAAESRAVTLEFNTSADYTNNFTEVQNPGNMSFSPTELAVVQSASSASSSAAYNGLISSSADFSLSFDVKFSGGINSLASSSAGFYTNLSGTDGSSTGYLIVFRITTATTADLRIFEGANLAGGNLGSITPTTRTVSVSNGTFSINTYYTFNLNVGRSEAPGGSLTFSGSILNAANDALLASFTDYTDSTPTNFASGQLGIRLGSTGGTPNTSTTMDNFTLTTSAVPEPSAFAALGGLAALGCAALRRRRRA